MNEIIDQELKDYLDAAYADYGSAKDQIERLVKRVAAKEREACAQLAVDAIAFNGGTVQMEAHVRQAIEARGEA